MNVVCLYPGHASLATIRRDFGHEFTARKFPKPPKFIVDLPQSVFECAFNAQRLQEHSTQLRQKLTNDCAHAMGMGMSRRLTPPTFSS